MQYAFLLIRLYPMSGLQEQPRLQERRGIIKLGNTTRTGRSGKELEKFDNPFRTMLSRNDPLLDSSTTGHRFNSQSTKPLGPILCFHVNPLVLTTRL